MRVTFLSDNGKVAEEEVDQGGVGTFFQLLVAEPPVPVCLCAYWVVCRSSKNLCGSRSSVMMAE